MLQRLARFCYRRRWRILGAWVVLLIGLFALNSTVGGKFLDEFDLPGSESQEAVDLMEEHDFNDRAGATWQIVFKADDVTDPTVQRDMQPLFDQIAEITAPSEVVSPYSEEGAHQISQRGPEAGRIAYAEVNLADRDSDELYDIGTEAREAVADADIPGVQVELGGDIAFEQTEFSSEVIGFVAALIILLIAFGSLLAAGLPLVTAIFGIVTGIAILGLVVNVIAMPSFSNQAVAMNAIGVGIDYALFIVTRYREGLSDGMTPECAIMRALDTAGRAVLFAGCTVIIAILGLFTIGLDMIRGLAVGISIGVLMTLLAALTLLPAILGFVGKNIDKFGLPHRRRAERAGRQSFWYRWSRVIQRRPWPALLASAAVLILLTIPLFGLRLGFGDAGNQPTDQTVRRAYDLMSEGFGPGANGPLLLAAETPGGQSDLQALEALSRDLNETEGVAFATEPIPNDSGDAAIIQVQPTTSPQDKETAHLVNRLRDDVVPDAVAGSTADVKVGGATAAVVDFSRYIADRLPWFIGAVLVLSFLLLTVVFRSLLVPLKAVIMNLLSVGAAYGILVAVFQWGWGDSLLGVGREGPIEAWIPIFLFAVIFGLSMDYEVFLLSRIREDYDRTHDNATAVANGLAVTARVITAAAAIMFCVFMSFVLGDRNWWLPRWLDRILPVIHVEAEEAVVAGTAPELREPERVG
jgi:RND superfamily putative drug exporter